MRYGRISQRMRLKISVSRTLYQVTELELQLVTNNFYNTYLKENKKSLCFSFNVNCGMIRFVFYCYALFHLKQNVSSSELRCISSEGTLEAEKRLFQLHREELK